MEFDFRLSPKQNSTLGKLVFSTTRVTSTKGSPISIKDELIRTWWVKLTAANYISLFKILCPVQIDRFDTQLVSNQLIHFKSTQAFPRLVQNRY